MARYVKASGTAAEEGTFAKIIHVPGLILCTIVSTLILVGLERNWVIDGNGSAYHTITNAPTATQQIVTVTSTILGTIYANAIAKLVNQATRIILARQPTSLHRLKLWYALSTISLDRSVRWAELPLVVVVYFALSQGPSALWSGALAPIPVVTQDIEASITLPQYTDQSYRYWSRNSFYPGSNDTFLINTKGTFSYLPIRDRLGYLIVDGSSASSIKVGQPQIQTKNDNSNYTYIGRSYGVGSSVGLSDETLQNTTVKYDYIENGYRADVNCLYNTSTEFRLILAQPGVENDKWKIPYSYLATGWGPGGTPNGPTINCALEVEKCGGFIVGGIGGDQDIVAAGWWASTESGLLFDGFPNPDKYRGKTRPVLSKSFTTIAAGSGNPTLNQVQCSISMIPTAFNVNVSNSDRKLSVTPRNDSNVVDIEPTGFIADSAASVLALLSSQDMSFRTSIISSILTRNINNKISQQGLSGQTQLQDVATLQGIAESIERLIDDNLLATASAQLMVAKDTYYFTPIIHRNGLKIGAKRVVVPLVIINALIIALFIEEALRTRNWKTLPKFDYASVENIIVATSLGGSDLGNAVLSKSNWFGGGLIEAAGDVKVIVSHEDHVQLGIAKEDYEGTKKRGSEDGVELIQSDYSKIPHSDQGKDDENSRKPYSDRGGDDVVRESS